MKIGSKLMLLGAGALLVAGTEASAQSGIKISKDMPAASTTPSSNTMTVAGGEVVLTPAFDLNAYAGMTEKNITAHMAAGDSLEIQISQLAQSKATNARVRDYAAMLQHDHTAHLAKTHEIITDEKVGAEPMAVDPQGLRAQAMLNKLREMPAGQAWDAAFLRFQAQHHQNEIDLLNANVKAAHDDDLEQHISASLTSLAKHRDTARSIATTLGVSMP